MFEFERFCLDHNIPTTTQHHHCSSGWIASHCPFCGSMNFHLGYNPYGQYFNCWKCGSHSVYEFVAKVTHSSKGRVKEILKTYCDTSAPLVRRRKSKRIGTVLKPPSGLGPLRDNHRRYLMKRGFDPDELEFMYHLKGIGPISGPGWKHRLMIPIIHEGEVVTYQGRDVTGRSDIRYKSMRTEDSLMDIKSTLYGYDNLEGLNFAVVVEGPVDVWRLGPGAVATFGTEFTLSQAKMLRKQKIVYIMYDNSAKDPNAQRQAKKLAALIRSIGTFAVSKEPGACDPGELSPYDARTLMNNLRESAGSLYNKLKEDNQ